MFEGEWAVVWSLESGGRKLVVLLLHRNRGYVKAL